MSRKTDKVSVCMPFVSWMSAHCSLSMPGGLCIFVPTLPAIALHKIIKHPQLDKKSRRSAAL